MEIRKCQCGTILSTYNNSPYCGACYEKKRESYLDWNRKRHGNMNKPVAEEVFDAQKVFCSNEECGALRNVYLVNGETLRQYLTRRPLCLKCTSELNANIEWKRK